MGDIKNLSASTKYKKTPIGEIPIDWGVVKLGEVAEVIMGQSPPSSTYNEKHEGLPFFQGNADFGLKHPIKRVYCSSPQKEAKRGDILVSVRAPVGALNIANETCCIGRGVAALRPSKMHGDFLYYVLQSFNNRWQQIQQGSTFGAISKNDLAQLLLTYPPLPEQEKIAEVLTSVDDTIEKTQKLIEQTKILQKALTQKLLTKGIPGLHKKFKKTPLGEIPEDWEVVKLGDVLIVVRNGLAYKQSQNTGRYSITRIETISEGVINANKVGYLDHLTDDEIRSNKLRPGDILFSNINSLEHIAKTAIYLSSYPTLIHGMNLLLLRPNKSKIEPFFLLFYLKFNETINRFRRLSKKAINQVSINQTEIKYFPVPLPPLEEQKSIVNTLLAIEHNLASLLSQKSQIEVLKQSLMQSLLSGKVRVIN